jgi:hypothetical protein
VLVWFVFDPNRPGEVEVEEVALMRLYSNLMAMASAMVSALRYSPAVLVR